MSSGRLERLERLVDVVLDGEASAEERTELEGLVAENPEAQARLAERKAWFEMLHRIPKRMPADDLRDSVLARIRNIPHQGADPGWVPSGRLVVARHPAWGFAYAIAAGLVIVSLTTLAVIGRIGQRADEGPPIAGTMAPVPVPGRIVDGGRFELPGASYQAETRANDRIVSLRLWGRSSTPAEMTIDYVPEELRLASLPPSETRNLRIIKGRIRFTASGEMKLELTWVSSNSAPSPLSVRTRIGEKEEAMKLSVSPRSRESPHTP